MPLTFYRAISLREDADQGTVWSSGRVPRALRRLAFDAFLPTTVPMRCRRFPASVGFADCGVRRFSIPLPCPRTLDRRAPPACRSGSGQRVFRSSPGTFIPLSNCGHDLAVVRSRTMGCGSQDDRNRPLYLVPRIFRPLRQPGQTRAAPMTHSYRHKNESAGLCPDSAGTEEFRP